MARVLGKNVQNRKFDAAENAVGKQVDEGAGVAVTKVVWMRTHCANFGVAGKPQLRVGHLRQSPIYADAKIISHS